MNFQIEKNRSSVEYVIIIFIASIGDGGDTKRESAP
jgi:hypothetical protein